MGKLTQAEVQVMEYIWQSERVFMKDLLERFPEPKPAVTTVATLLKRMQEKGFVGYRTFGNSREYYALISKEDYFSGHVNELVKNYFNDSSLQFASFFARNGNLSKKELESLRALINSEIDKKGDDRLPD
jgi:BlaI family penicillinase repressor